MPTSPISSNVDQSLDIHGNFPPQVTFHFDVFRVNDIGDSRNFVFL